MSFTYFIKILGSVWFIKFSAKKEKRTIFLAKDFFLIGNEKKYKRKIYEEISKENFNKKCEKPFFCRKRVKKNKNKKKMFS